METRPDIRASDADRDRVVEKLRDHAAAGRLTTDELEERVDAALVARTAARPQRVKRRRHGHGYRWRTDWGYSPHVRVYLSVMVLLVAIWLMTTPGGYFWPMWPALGWGIGVFAHGSARKCGVRRDDAPEPRVQMM